MNIQLYIENYEIELDTSVQFLLNKLFEELSNPTIVINSWSKTVSIPFTENNNRIFGYLYKPDRILVQTSDPDSYRDMGIYFDPTKKLDFQLIFNNMVLMSGYAKMNTIKQNGTTGEYDITLFGQLGKIFLDLSKITFNINDENSDYIINGSQYVDTTINKTLVVSSWNSNGQTHSSIDDSTITDIIGFAPNNSYYDEFDSKSYQSGTAVSNTFTETLKTKWDNGNGGYVTGLDPETAIPNGMLPRDIGEFRSYYQTPFIYWNKLWLIFLKKAELLTGYTWDLDSDWFNTTNPYYYQLVYMLKPFDVKNGTSLENHYTKWGRTAVERSLGRSTTPGVSLLVQKMAMPTGESVVTNNKNETYPLMNTYEDPEYDRYYPHYPTSYALFKCPEEFTSITFKWHIPMYFLTKVSSSHIRDNSGLIVTMKLWGCNDLSLSGAHVVQTNNYIIRHEGSGFTYRDYTPIDTGTSSSSGEHRYEIYWTIDSNFHASAAKCGPYCYFTLECSFTDSDPITNGLGDAAYTYYRENSSLDVNLSSGAFRSGTHFTLNDLWDNSFNLFEQILNYCKMYRILVFTDDFEKKLKFIRAPKYFIDYTITDWTDKLDMSKDFVITPMTFDNKYVIYNYKDNESKLGKSYKEKWGVNYGEKKLITQYNFNDSEKKLFDKDIVSSITNTDFSLSWTNLYDNNTISYSLPAEIFPYAKDKEGKKTDNFGSFYFFTGRKAFDTTALLRMRSVKVSDDTTFQQSNDTYYYSQSQDGTAVNYYPGLDVIYGSTDKLCLFNKPMENFTYAKNLGNGKGIYDMFWDMYINERYNLQNKLVSCYLKLTPKDFMNFEFRNFIKINGVIYIINKIYDYDVTYDKSTKVDLVSIYDLTAYYVDYYSDYLTVSPESISIDGESGTQDITVNAYNNLWKYELLDENGEVVSLPTEVTLTRVNDTTLRIVKNGDYSFNYTIRIYTLTHSQNVILTGAKSLYITSNPQYILVQSGQITEFDVTIQTNYANVTLAANNTIQWYDGSAWKTSAWDATRLEGWGSGDSTVYNEAHEEREFTLHLRTNNPTATGFIQLYDSVTSESSITSYCYITYSVDNDVNVRTFEYKSNSGVIYPYNTSALPTIASNTTSSYGYSIICTVPITTIGEKAFYGRTTLKEIHIVKGTTTIGNSAFENCTGLQTVNLEYTLTKIGKNAFKGCSQLSSIVYGGSKYEWGKITKGDGWKDGIQATFVQCLDGQEPL